MSNVQAQGTVLGQVAPGGRSLATGTQTLSLADGGEQRVVNAMALDAQAAALGGAFYSFATTVGVAATQTVPTTGACTSLWNGNAAGTNIAFLVKWAGAVIYTGSATQGPSAYQLLVRNDVPGANSAPSSNKAIITQTDGRLYSGSALVCQNVTLAAISATNNCGWIPAGLSSIWGATASLGSFYGLQVQATFNGQFIVRPQGMFSLAVLGGVAASNLSFIGGFIWEEIKLAI